MPDIIAQASLIIERPAPVGEIACPAAAVAEPADGFIDKDKTILSASEKWFISKEHAAKLCGYANVDAIHNKARRENWQAQECQVQGGLKKFYAVESLPTAAQISFHKELNSRLAPQDDGAGTNAYQRASEKMRRRAERRFEVLKCWRDYLKTTARKNRTKATKDFVALWNVTHPDAKICRANLYRYDAAEKQDGMSGLTDDYPRQPNNVAAWSDEARAYLESLYLDQSRRDIFSCYQNMKFMARQPHNNWKIPHPSTCRRHLLKLSRDIVTYLREGSKAFHDRGFPSIQRDPNSIEVGQVYVADDRMADVSFGAGNQGDRIWCTAWMDMRSRKVLSLVFTYKGNSTQAVLDGFYQAAQLHICDELYFDNGGNYREAGYVAKDQELMPKHLQAPFNQLFGADKIHWALPGNARSKVVERAFLEMARINDKNHIGYTGMNVLKRPEGWYLQRAEGNFLSAQEIVRNIKNYFFEIHNNFSPEGRPSPNQIWAEHFSKHNYKRAEAEYLRNLLLRTHPKLIKLRENGIEFGRMCNGACADAGKRCHCRPRFYWDDAIQLLTGGIKEVWVKFSEFEPEHIWIYRKDGTPIGEVPEYSFNSVPALRAGKIVGEYQSKKNRRIKEIEAKKQQLQDIHNLNLNDPEKLMQRDDIAPEPQPAINFETGEVIEKVEEFKTPIVELPMPIESLRKRSKKIQKRIDNVDDVLSNIPSPMTNNPSDTWDRFDNL